MNAAHATTDDAINKPITELVISHTGSARCVYSEAVDMRALGRVTILRGSHVEPTTDGCWTADLAPVNGPRLGPFTSRSAALHAEQCWLSQHWLNRPLTNAT